ncbi:DUF1822 family protein [Cyanobacteria bacterium FACHB-DQ100]|uniref:DUF1822 family protein n=1 Tax=Leptolyngbya sp. DQ-M1 TaxID=2933920 RepID=UPI001995D11A|nr:DUF1822 family protein [Cyanobacteria bacterium FACHB-DQ100]
MSDLISSVFTVPLAARVHQQAEQFRRQYTDGQKAKQVYLNTLAVQAVNYYLQCIGIETDWEASHSANPVMQILLDVADLNIRHRGKLECRPILPNAQTCPVPVEAQSDRIGFVAVQLNESLTEATLLGFSPTLQTGRLMLRQLRSLDELPSYLHSLAPVNQAIVTLRQWLDEYFEAGWQAAEMLLFAQALSPAYSFRSAESDTDLSDPSTQTRGAKLIQLDGSPEPQTVALLVSLIPEEDVSSQASHVRVVLQVHPIGDQVYLPEGLELTILLEEGQIQQSVQARSTDDYIQKQLMGSFGERFSVNITLGNASYVESFVI